MADDFGVIARYTAKIDEAVVSRLPISPGARVRDMEVSMATLQTTIDQAKQEAFVYKVLGDTSASMTTLLASIGDRLGLFKDLAAFEGCKMRRP